MTNVRKPIFTVIGGIISLVIVMGIGRFAYTPILPLMQKDLGLSDVFLGNLASLNFLGYLLGALGAGIINWKNRKTFYLRFFLITNIVATIFMGITEFYLTWFLLRFISGLTSGFVFVFASSIVMDILAKEKRLTWSGLFYSGVGLGIFITGLMVPFFDHFYGWEGSWLGLGFIALILSVIVLVFLKDGTPTLSKQEVRSKMKQNRKNSTTLPWLIASYGCEGVGYIISGTFIVAIVAQIPALTNFPTISWVIVGAAAIPSCIIWSLLAKRWGTIVTLQILFAIQIIGIILPVFFATAFGAILASFLFGATFMGITTLFVSEARLLAPKESMKVIGNLTFVYGIGQVIGPIIAGYLITNSGNYESALIFASLVLVLGMLFLVIYQLKSSKTTEQENHIIVKL